MDEAAVNQQVCRIGVPSRSVPTQPCGQSARYEPEFEQLEAELAKQESLTPTAVDWGRVVELLVHHPADPSPRTCWSRRISAEA